MTGSARWTRRRWLGAHLGGAAGLVSCDRDDASQGRSVATLWFTYGGRNREVLETLVARFNESQREHFVRAVYQGDYYEGLAKLRTAVFAKAGPTFSHVIGEVVPYLARAGVLQPLDVYPNHDALDIVPELGQSKSWVGGDRRPLVALPFNRSTPIAYLNGNLLDQLGLEAPRTWDELRRFAQLASLSRKSGPKR